jgi:hypothetical protein
VATAPPIELAVKGLPQGEDRCAGFDRPVGQQDVGGDHHAAGAAFLCDPVVGRVEAIADHHASNQRVIRHTQRAIADHGHRNMMAQGDFVDFLFDRTCIGIDQNLESVVGWWRGNGSKLRQDAV